jgi:hypothetical protein
MRIVNIYEGELGDSGADGINGAGVDDIGYTELANPVLDLFRNNKKSVIGDITASRASAASIIDRYGNNLYLPASTINNQLTYSEDFSQWTDIASSWTLLSTGISDPLGGSNASTIRIDKDNGQLMLGLPYSVPVSGTYTGSFWIKNNTGTVTEISIQKDANAEIQVIPIAVTGAWQRVSISYAEDANGTFYINARGTVGTTFDLFGAQVNTGSALTDYLKTTGTTVSQPFAGEVLRQNQLGALIEPQEQNLLKYSEDLSQAAWDIAGADLSTYDSIDIFGKINQNTKLTFTSTSLTVGQSATITAGQQYTLSFWIKSLTANISSIVANVGGIVSDIDIENLTTDFTRVSATITAGSLQSFSASVTAESAGDIVVTGFQLEFNYLSSYTETAQFPTTRAADIVSVDYESLPLGNMPFTVVMTLNEPFESASDKFIFSNGDADEFSAKISGGNFVVRNGATALSVDGSKQKYEIVSDGSTMTVYSNAETLGSVALNSPNSTIVPSLFIGCDGSANQLAGYLQLFKIYDKALTFNQIRCLRGSDYE